MGRGRGVVAGGGDGAGFLATATREPDLALLSAFADAFAEAVPEPALREPGRTRAGAVGTFFATFLMVFTDDFAESFFDIGQPSPRSWQ